MDHTPAPDPRVPPWEAPFTFDPDGLQAAPLEFHRGDLCPNCGEGVLEYDGMLNLGCETCGFSLVGCFT